MLRTDLERQAMRAVELVVLGRDNPRLLIAAKRRLTRPRRVARLLAGLANSADGRQPLLLLGVGKRHVVGVERTPDEDWWDRVRSALPGRRPELRWDAVSIDGAMVVVVAPDSSDELIPACKRDRVVVPFFDGDRLVYGKPTRPEPVGQRQSIPTASVVGGWVERRLLGSGSGAGVDTYRGVLELEVGAVTGVMRDIDCSATLMSPDQTRSMELDVQVHPAPDAVGVFRTASGIEVRGTFRVRLLIAGAVRSASDRGDPPSLHLVVSLLLPGRAVPELRSLLLRPDPSGRRRWVI